MGGLLKIKRKSFLRRSGSGRSLRSSSAGGAMYVPSRHTELLTEEGPKKKHDAVLADVAKPVATKPSGAGTSGQKVDNATQPKEVPSVQPSQEVQEDTHPKAPLESDIKSQVSTETDDLDDVKEQLEDEVQKQKERLIPELSMQKHNKDTGLPAGKIGAVCLLVILPVLLFILQTFFGIKPQLA